MALITTVYLYGPDGNLFSFGPDSADIPEWATDEIGEHAFEEGTKPVKADGAPIPVDFTKLKKPDLVAECAARGLDVEGTVPDLVQRLTADDAAKAPTDF